MRTYIFLFLKGLAMGAANVIPGVSGGTIALITGIYEKLIRSVKSFDLEALKLLSKFKIQALWERVNGWFLVAVFAGIAVSILSLAKLLKMLLENPDTELLVMGFFFGLILASVYSVGKTVAKWATGTYISLIIGLVIAVGIALLTPASENDAMWYLGICGVVAMCSMILPGLSGSFVLIIMGNYKLVMLDAVSELNLKILIPVAIGAGIGLIAFSQVLTWVFERYKDLTIALMTGFILGSLVVIWPWKKVIPLTNEAGEVILKKGKEVISGFDWYMPDLSAGPTWGIVACILLGIATLWGMERAAARL